MPISKWQKFGAVRMPLIKWNNVIAGLTVKAEAGDAQAQWEFGSLLDGGLLDPRGETFAIRPDKRAALIWFQRSAKAGNPSGQVSLGNYEGNGVMRDPKGALRCFHKALQNAISAKLGAS